MTSKRNQNEIIEHMNVIDIACSKLKEEDFTHRGFLRPI